MPNLKTVQDDDECLLLYDLNWSENLDLPYNYEKFDLDSPDDECKSEFRFD